MKGLLSLCKRRGFFYPSNEIYSIQKGAFDYGHYGILLKNNLVKHWWRHTVKQSQFRNGAVYGVETPILTLPQVFKASGHLDTFFDICDQCALTGSIFRIDKAQQLKVSAISPDAYLIDIQASNDQEAASMAKMLSFAERKSGNLFRLHCKGQPPTKAGDRIIVAGLADAVEYQGYSAPVSNSVFLKGQRRLNLMFKTAQEQSDLYLRPETTQGIMTSFLNLVIASRAKLPFGAAQVGKSFRNELSPEHALFRSLEFEQMELEFFIEPTQKKEAFEYFKEKRFDWWKSVLSPSRLRMREHEKDELAHYAQRCADVEYEFPWGYSELEGIADRGDFDLNAHSKASGQLLSIDGIVPHVIECSAGLGRGMLALLHDSYWEESQKQVLKIPPFLAPVKVSVFPVTPKPELIQVAEKIKQMLDDEDIECESDSVTRSIGKKYYRSDEIGTPYSVVADNETLENSSVTVRFRDSGKQERISVANLVHFIKDCIKSSRTL